MTSNLQYCSIIWLFCSKAADTLINRITKRAMRITYNSDSEETLDALLQRDGTLTIHKKIFCMKEEFGLFRVLKISVHKRFSRDTCIPS